MVLVVDDELEIRDLLSSFLTEEGYEVILASFASFLDYLFCPFHEIHFSTPFCMIKLN
jgi:DNA-binding response OmpR family regulator